MLDLCNKALKRDNGSTDTNDVFRAYPFPVPAANPSLTKANHLYLAYADKAQNADPNDLADVFFVRLTDGGTTWTSRERISTVPTNDQWMPMVVVKLDGSKLFVAWYDRRNDSENSFIDVYGRWGTIASDGSVTFGTEIRISNVGSPPVFPGTLADNKITGRYDPVYPPGGVNLSWWYTEWPTSSFTPSDYLEGHVGEYNGAHAEGSYVYISWADNRSVSSGTQYLRRQRDIRLVRVPWPE